MSVYEETSVTQMGEDYVILTRKDRRRHLLLRVEDNASVGKVVR